MDVDAHVNEESSAPLLGVVLCCTSISPEKQSAMLAVAQQMGAVVKLDLTSDVTHLVVGNIDTPKYKYVAKERTDIKVVSPDWVIAVRASWLEGGITDVQALEQQFRLPTFMGLRICVTGFDNVDERNRISETVLGNGAFYHGDLTKAVTHLIAKTPKGKKYEYAGTWGIKIVGVEWFRDSIERGMVLDEKLYHPAMPVEERGLGAVTIKNEAFPQPGKRRRVEERDPFANYKKRKLRRTASAKLESQNDNMWADMGADEDVSEVKAPAEMWDEELKSVGDAKHIEKDEIMRTSTSMREQSQPLIEKTNESMVGLNRMAAISEGGAGKVRLYVHGFDARKTGILYSCLESTGAEVLRRQDMVQRPATDGSVVIIVPHDIALADFQVARSETFILPIDEFVTDFWVEVCLYSKLFEPTAVVVHKPLLNFPIAGFERLMICPTMFVGIHLLHFSKVVKLMGAEYDEYLSRKTSVLVSHSEAPSLTKVNWALTHGVPVVSASWLWDCVEQGALLPFESYRIGLPGHSRKNSDVEIYAKFGPLERQRSIKSNSVADLPRRTLGGRLELEQAPSKTASHPAVMTNTGDEAQAETGQRQPSPSRPLQELDPVMNSPRPHSHSPSNHRNARPILPDAGVELSVIEVDQSFSVCQPVNQDEPSVAGAQEEHRPHQPREDPTKNPPPPLLREPSSLRSSNGLNDAIEHVLAARRAAAAAAAAAAASDPSISATTTTNTTTIATARPRRKLGRAQSETGSTTSATTAAGRPLSRAESSLDALHGAGSPVPEGKDENDAAQQQEYDRQQTEAYLFRPSQALSYEDPEAQAAREKLMKRMGLATFGDEEGLGNGMTKVESIGVLKDAGKSVAEAAGRRRMTRKRGI